MLRLAILALLVPACTAPGALRRGPDAQIPVFAKGDPRVNTAGFVGETLRLHKEQDGVRYTLMAFVVGKTLTLGAMVRGAFHGQAVWRVGDRTLTLRFDSSDPGRTKTARDATGKAFAAQGASFRGTAWVNIEVPLAGWAEDGTALQLEFLAAGGEVIALPDRGHAYRVVLAKK